MIITVTMNPAIDKTIDVDQLQKGELNRIKGVEKDVGGKGINVSKTINELGGKSTAIGFIAGDAGKTIEHVLNREGIQTDFIEVEGVTKMYFSYWLEVFRRALKKIFTRESSASCMEKVQKSS